MFAILTKRNRQLFLQQNHWLISIILFTICLSLILKLMGQSYYDVYRGALQLGGPIYVPHIWLTFTLLPFLATGPSVRQLIKGQYAHLHQVPLVTYVLSVLQIVAEVTLLIWMIPVIILHPSYNGTFVLLHFCYLLLLVMIYSLGSLFLKPIHVLEILLVLLICCIVQNDFFILSQLMAIRFDFNHLDISFHFGCLGLVIGGLIYYVKNIDFLID